jgi:hypothetical protein
MPGTGLPVETFALDQRFGEASRLAGGRDYSWANSPGGWLLFVSLCVAFLVLKYAVNRFFAKRQATQLDTLMTESAEFVARWPRERLTYAPHTELMAEAERSRRVISLLQRRANARNADKQSINNQMTAANYWLATVHAAMNVAAEREHRPSAG